jgi:hypothetical protein
MQQHQMHLMRSTTTEVGNTTSDQRTQLHLLPRIVQRLVLRLCQHISATDVTDKSRATMIDRTVQTDS